MSSMDKQRRAFSPKTFLTTDGAGRTLISFRKGQTIYSQGDTADALFVIQSGKVQLRVKSQNGKYATLDIVSDEDFVGEDSIAGYSFRTASAIAITGCSVLRIGKDVMMVALKREMKLATLFWEYVLARSMRYQQDLVDQRRNPSQKRLARVLLQLTHHDRRGPPEITIPSLSHETLAEMVGTTRSRICFFMNGFKESGFIHYERKGRVLRVHRSLVRFCDQ
jgi:CRP/FNR family transcriptional regulator, cyclic AMP receptor protein